MGKLVWVIFFGFLIVGCSSVKPMKNEPLAKTQEDSVSSRTAMAEELFTAFDMNKLFEETIDQMLELQIKKNPNMEPYRATMRSFFRKYMSFEILKPEFVKLYIETYTTEELSDITTFYKTKTGQKAIKTMPVLMAKGGEIGQMAVQAHAGELTDMIKEQSKSIKGTKN